MASFLVRFHLFTSFLHEEGIVALVSDNKVYSHAISHRVCFMSSCMAFVTKATFATTYIYIQLQGPLPAYLNGQFMQQMQFQFDLKRIANKVTTQLQRSLRPFKLVAPLESVAF